MPDEFILRYTGNAKEIIDRLGGKDKSVIDKKLEMLKHTPYRFPRKPGWLAACRAAPYGSDGRIIYSICRECMDGGFQDKNICGNYCARATRNDVIIIAIGSHKDLQSLRYGGVD